MTKVTFYQRAGERTFVTDPYRVAEDFLAHRYGERAQATAVSKLYFPRFLADYMRLKGATWARPGDEDPYLTRRSFDVVCQIVGSMLDLPSAHLRSERGDSKP